LVKNLGFHIRWRSGVAVFAMPWFHVPRRLPWRASHKPTFSRRREPHAPLFDPVRCWARKPIGVARWRWPPPASECPRITGVWLSVNR